MGRTPTPRKFRVGADERKKEITKGQSADRGRQNYCLVGFIMDYFYKNLAYMFSMDSALLENIPPRIHDRG